MDKGTNRKENDPMRFLKLRTDNRNIVRKHVEEIKKSISENGYMDFKPIIINRDNEIIDGQHRYIACSELGITPPTLTINENSTQLMVSLNKTQKSWGINDFIKFHAENGNRSYIMLKDFIAKTGLAPTPALLLLVSEKNLLKFDDIKEGRLNIQLTDKQFEEAVETAQEINKIAKLMRLVKGNKILTEAYIALLKVENFNKDYFFDKILRYRDELYLCGSLKGYLQMFVAVYNHGKKRLRITL